jgi:hypothetical protein
MGPACRLLLLLRMWAQFCKQAVPPRALAWWAAAAAEALARARQQRLPRRGWL